MAVKTDSGFVRTWSKDLVDLKPVDINLNCALYCFAPYNTAYSMTNIEKKIYEYITLFLFLGLTREGLKEI